MPIAKAGFFFWLLIISFLTVNAQKERDFKFGRVTQQDFNMAAPLFDSGAHAVIVGDIGKSIIRPNSLGGYNYEFFRKMRVKILDANGIDAGVFSFPTYLVKGSSSRESVSDLKAVTYNIEGGKVIETKLANDQIHTEKQSAYLYLQKFSLPALKAGTIFEISYTIESDFLYYFRPWLFQHNYPCLWSEYETEVPEYFLYDILYKGDHPFTVRTERKDARSFNVSTGRNRVLDNLDTYNLVVNVNRWVKVNIPSLKKEDFVASAENYRNKIEFQPSAVNLPNQITRSMTPVWGKICKGLLEDEDFGAMLDLPNQWLDDLLKTILVNSFDTLDKARRIHAYIRDNFTVIKNNSIFTSSGIKTANKNKKGNVADVNLLLIAMLKHEKINCYPIILSTRPNGLPNGKYPVINDYNYVACIAWIGKTRYFLDAGSKEIPFGQLDNDCYNGVARKITPEAGSINLSSDSIVDNNLTYAVLIPDQNVFKGKITLTAGLFKSTDYRRRIANVGLKKFNEEFKSGFGPDIEVSDGKIDSLSIYNEPIQIENEVGFRIGDGDLSYVNPVLSPFFKENPFHAAQRKWAIEMPSRLDWTYILNLGIPPGYEIDEMPKSEKVKFNENDGVFEYIVSQNDRTIQLKTKLILCKANFNADDYEILRDFFSYIIKKQSEQIVLRKK